MPVGNGTGVPNLPRHVDPAQLPAGEARRRRWGMVITGASLLVAGLAAGGALFGYGATQRSLMIDQFTRAPAGCATTLDIDRPGTYVMYLEHRSTVDRITGSCRVSGTISSTRLDTPPAIEITADNGGASPSIVATPAGESFSYTEDVYAGRNIATFDVGTTGRYVINIEPSLDDQVVAIAHRDADPAHAFDTVRLPGAVAAGAAVVGAVLLVIGLRRNRTLRPPFSGPMGPQSWGPNWTLPPRR